MKFSRNILKDDLDFEETVLVHGTSIETVLALLKKGRLEKESFTSKKLRTSEEDYLFFMPTTEHFQRREHPLFLRIQKLKYFGDTLAEAETYAKDCAFEHYLTSQLGEKPYVHLGDYDLDYVFDRYLRQARGKGFSEAKARDMVREALKRKGVLLGIDEKIFELKIEPAFDEKDEVCICLPEGLDGKYVSGVLPLGKIEKKLLEEFFER